MRSSRFSCPQYSQNFTQNTAPLNFAASRIMYDDPFRFDPERAYRAIPRAMIKEISEQTASQTHSNSSPTNKPPTLSLFLLGAVLALFATSWFLLFRSQSAQDQQKQSDYRIDKLQCNAGEIKPTCSTKYLYQIEGQQIQWTTVTTLVLCGIGFISFIVLLTSEYEKRKRD